MIVISSLEYDNTTCEVMDWLLNKVHVTRLNCDQLIIDSFAPLLPISMDLESSVKSIWFRKEGVSYVPEVGVSLPSDCVWHAARELGALKAAVATIPGCYTLGKLDSNFNKVNCLQYMMQYGLKVPPTLVTGKKSELRQFIHEQGDVIVKPISDGARFKFGDKFYKIFTERVDELIEDLEEDFFPGLFQKNIRKEIEIRSLYLEGKIYSMAIFSQANPATQTDHRHYDRIHPNRKVPFNLPSVVEQKIVAFMTGMNLNIGVFDIIKETSGEYTFLELNPYGQFGDISKTCNYFIEMKVAELLVKNN